MSVQVWGTTKLLKMGDGSLDPSWQCFVDKISIGATKPFEFPENNWLLCEQKVLVDEQHKITVNVNTTNHMFWFNRNHYTPSPSISLDAAVVVVDNHDSGISFDSGWRELGGSANMTQSTGSSARFMFTGTSVSWVGFIPTELPHDASSATYSVDGDPPIPFLLKGLPQNSTTVYNQIFFETPELKPGLHSLVVVHQGTGQQTPLTLDFLYVTNTSTPNPNPNSASPSSSSSTNPTTGTPTPQPDNNETPVGVIVGGVLGGLALVALALLIIWWYKRGQRRVKLCHNSNAPTIPPHLEVSPFVYGHIASESYTPDTNYGTSTYPSLQSDLESQRGFPEMISYTLSLPPTTPGTHGSQSILLNSRHGPSASMSSSTTSGYNLGTVVETREMRKYQEQPPQPVRHAVVHEDSGLRLGRRTVIDVPPTYTPD